MVDIISLTIAIGSLLVAILSHIKKSKCSSCFEVETYEQIKNE